MAIGSRSLAGLSIGVLAVFRAAGIGFQNPDAIDLPSLLRARRQRPRGSATEQRDELAARHVGHGPSALLRDTGCDITKRPPRPPRAGGWT